MKKKALALLLALCLVISLMPVTAMAAPAARTAQIEAQPELTGDLQALPQLPVQPDGGSYKVTATVVKGSSHGEIELSASSANARDSVYLLANPDDGYLVEFGGQFEYYYYELELNYLGMDLYEIVMPDGDVSLEISFVAAEGSNHSISLEVNDPNGGTVTASRSKAKEGESVILAVTVNPGYTLDALYATYGDGEGAMGGYLGAEDGVDYFEVFMPGDKLYIKAVFVRNGPYGIQMVLDSEPEYGTAVADVTQAYQGDTVTLTLTPAKGCRLVSAVVWCSSDNTTQQLTSIGGNRYTFTMPGDYVEVHVVFEPIISSVSVTVDTGLGGTAFADVTEAMAGETVTLTCLPEEGYRVAQITGVSGLTDNGDGTYTFSMPGKAVDIHVLFLRHENPFLDVNETHFFYESVLWAVENGITNGISATQFGPFLTTNRAAVVTMLWRFAGCPEPETTVNPFTDVADTDWYAKAVLWAVENGITNGVGNDQFGPGLECNRAQVVTFLWRFLGNPQPQADSHPFTDVEEGSFYEQAVMWALENGITTGATATTFAPNGQCQRAQFVTFLYRTAQLPEPEAPTDPEVPSDPQVPGDDIPPSDEEGPVYILNTATKKFHYEGCFSAEQIVEENYHLYIGPRERLLAYDYTPCGHCDP